MNTSVLTQKIGPLPAWAWGGLAALARGSALAEIAGELGISVTTARTHVARIFLAS